MKNILVFLGHNIKRETFFKKDIYKYLKNQGNVIVPKIDYNYSLKQNIGNIKFEKNKKYILIGHSIGAFFVYYLNQIFEHLINFYMLRPA